MLTQSFISVIEMFQLVLDFSLSVKFYFISRNTSSRAVLGEGVLQYWYQSGVLRSLPYTRRMLGRVRTCVRQLDKLAQLIAF